jgi:hypothetical protein
MATSANEKIISIGAYQRPRAKLSAQESAGVLTDCRDLALNSISSALSVMLDRIEEDLFSLAENSRDREAQNLYLDARAQTREKRSAIEKAFSRHFVSFFDGKLKGAAPRARNAPDGGMLELKLLDDDALEETIAVQEMTKKLKAACEPELYALGRRMGFLMERPELEDDANPMSPDTICRALKDACDTIESGYKVRLTLLKLLERYVAIDMQRIYGDINVHLVQQQILPEIRVAARRNPATAPSAKGAAPDAKSAADAANPAGKPESGDLYGMLSQLLGSQAAPKSPADLVALASGASAAAQPGKPGMLYPGQQQFVSALTALQVDDQSLAAFAPPPQGGVIVPGELINVLHGLKASPVTQGVNGLDAMTIDIVAMLFDYVFGDRHIPEHVKPLLAKLQIPMLKVAILDKAFFSGREHPARRFLDLLAEASIGLTEHADRRDVLYAKIETVVTRVLDEFETDIRLFEELSSDLTVFLAGLEEAAKSVVERSARLIEEREKAEIARLIAEDEVARRLEARNAVPRAVRGFLEDRWVRTLAHISMNEGEASPSWTSALQMVDELLWSVEPKPGADERRRLVGLLPQMLRRLQEGMERIGVGEPDRDDFFGSLVDCHSAAVKAGLRGQPLAVEPEGKIADDSPPPEPKITRATFVNEGVTVEEITLTNVPRRREPEISNVFTRTGVLTNLQRGSWVEFVREAMAPIRARLTWISPRKGIYLFTNANGGSAAISVAPEALAEQMRVGEARLIDSGPLVDRAVDSMLANLRGAAA